MQQAMPQQITRNIVVRHKDDPSQLTARVTRVSPFGHIAWTERPIWGHSIHPTEDLIIVGRMAEQQQKRKRAGA